MNGISGTGTSHVLRRFALRGAILVTFATASPQPFWSVLTTLFVLAAAVSVTIALARGEPMLGPVLTHWDEAALYAALSRGALLLHWFAQGSAVPGAAP